MKYPYRASMVLAVLLLLAVPAFAKQSGGGHWEGGRKGWGLSDKLLKKAHLILKHQKEIGLTEEQVQQIREIKTNAKKGMILQDAEIEVLSLDIKNLLGEQQIDTEAVNKLIDEKYKIKVAKTKSLVDQYAKLKMVLSKEQYAKMKEIWYRDN